MSQVSDPALGCFYRLAPTDQLPQALRQAMPEVLWIAGGLESPPAGGLPAVLGHRLDERAAAPQPLASLDRSGHLGLHFDAGETIDGILLEAYHGGLQPALEMRLPFNYSRLPNWLKAVGRLARQRAMNPTAAIAFPSEQPAFVVEWLRQLAATAGVGIGERSLARPWPPGHSAAAIITHDVDTEWLFHHREWIERLCTLEERRGFAGAWYCVPAYCDGAAAHTAIEMLIARGAEIGCHGYNHDAKWPLLGGHEFDSRLETVRRFVERWGIRGFRSEWLWRSPTFLSAIAPVFAYDSSVPAVASSFTRRTRNGCGTCFPYRTHGDLIELPLTLPSDEARHLEGLGAHAFWARQVERAKDVIAQGGLVVLSIHPQPHQAANAQTVAAIDEALRQIAAVPGLWLARPDQIVDWLTSSPG